MTYHVTEIAKRILKPNEKRKNKLIRKKEKLKDNDK